MENLLRSSTVSPTQFHFIHGYHDQQERNSTVYLEELVGTISCQSGEHGDGCVPVIILSHGFYMCSIYKWPVTFLQLHNLITLMFL